MAYQPIQMPQPQGLDGFAEFILQARRQSQQEEQARAELLLRTQQHEANVSQNYAQQQQSAQQMGLQGAQLQLQQQKAQEEIAQKRLAATTQITAALDGGRPDLARQIAKTFGIDIAEQPGRDPRDTLMAPSPEAPQAPEYGPQATPEIARQAGNIRAELASFEPGAQGDQFYRDQAENERTRFETAQQPFEYMGQVPMSPRESTYVVNGEEYDPQQRREAEAKTRDLNTQQFAGAFKNIKSIAPYIPVYQAAVQAGNTPKEAFALMNERMKADDTARERAENARLQREQSDINNRRMAAAVGAGKSQGIGLKTEAGDRAEESTIDALTKNVFANTGFKEQQIANRRFNDMAAKLAVGNSAVDVAVMGEWAKQAQGGVGVLTDSDMKVFYERIGGFGIRGEEMIQKAINGQMGEGRRKLMVDAVKWLAGRANTNLNEIKESLRYRLDNSTFRDRTNDVMGTYFPAERNRIEEGRRIEAAKERTRAARLKGGGRDALDAELDGL